METHNEQKTHGISRFQEYLGEFVYGGIDGCVTTFAVVAGSAGANLDVSVVLILGFANLIADGFSMSVGNYLSTRSELANYDKHKRIEYEEIETIPEVEREEIREIYRKKGFEGELLEQVVAVITADKDRWVDTMMKEELEMLPETRSPFATASMTFISFVLVGLIPLLAYLLPGVADNPDIRFPVSCIMTAFGFVGIGWLKSYVTHSNMVKAIAETLTLGTLAAVLAYVVGNLLEQWLA